ncbi:SDR family oxidoreductase [Labilibacter sediminis]|nr:SDR family oxidoreductase [Labilibacter sediminis]
MKAPKAIITGATSGIGTGYVNSLAKKGWNLIITGRRIARLNKLKKEITQKYHVNVIAIPADFTCDEDIKLLLETIDYEDQIDLLINNAGFGQNKNFFENSIEEQQKMLKVHITATSKLIHHVVPKMILNQEGAIINVSSLSAFLPASNSYYYSASKAFLVSFSESLHIDLAGKNIKVQVLCPGFTQTEFHSRQGLGEAKSWLARKILWRSVDQVVNKSLKSLGRKRIICIPGFVNQCIYHILNIMPKRYYYYLASNRSNLVNPQNQKTVEAEVIASHTH